MLDSNVLQALIDTQHAFHTAALELFEREQRISSAMMICPVVYTEAHSFPMFQADLYLEFLADADISIDWQIPEQTWILAGLAQIEYHKRRRKSGVLEQRRLIADFVIGAHAIARDATLLSFDKGYRISFPTLELRSR